MWSHIMKKIATKWMVNSDSTRHFYNQCKIRMPIQLHVHHRIQNSEAVKDMYDRCKFKVSKLG